MSKGLEMKKVSRRIPAVLAGIAFITVGSLTACGGGEDQTDPTAPTTAATSAVTTETTVMPGAAVTTTTEYSPLTNTLESVVIGGVAMKLPADFLEAEGQRPIVLLFYVPGEVDDEEVVEAVRELRSTYPTYTFLIYDYKLPDAYGDLADLIGVGYQPFVALVDRHGVPHRMWSGYVDKGTLNQTLIDLGRL